VTEVDKAKIDRDFFQQQLELPLRTSETILGLAEPLRGESTADAPSRTAAGEPPIIDAKAYTIEADSPQPARATSAQPLVFGEMLDCTPKRSRLSLRDVSKRVPPSAADMVPAAARFIEGTHSNLAGGRAYRLFIPSRYVGQPLPLIVMLHGCTQSPEDFAAGTRMNFIAEERTCFVVYPAQHSKANQAKCWNWFRTADQQRGRGEPSLIARITRQIRLIHAASAAREGRSGQAGPNRLRVTAERHLRACRGSANARQS